MKDLHNQIWNKKKPKMSLKACGIYRNMYTLDILVFLSSNLLWFALNNYFRILNLVFIFCSFVGTYYTLQRYFNLIFSIFLISLMMSFIYKDKQKAKDMAFCTFVLLIVILFGPHPALVFFGTLKVSFNIEIICFG